MARTASARPYREKRRPAWRPGSSASAAALLLALVVLAVYWPVLGYGFIDYDDDQYVAKNPHVQEGLTLESLRWALTTTHAINWHPLTWVSHMVDCQLFKSNPTGHHLTSLLLHVANTLLVFAVFHRMTGRLWRSAFVAALFGVHPLHVESVVWIAERKDVLSTLFWMLTTLAYLRYVESPGARRYFPVAAGLALGLMAKPMLVTLPFVLLLLDYWPLSRFGDATKGRDMLRVVGTLSREKIPLFILCAASGVVTFLVQQGGGAMGPIRPTLRIWNALVAYVGYIVKLVWPRGLAIFYPHQGDALPAWEVAGSALLLIVATALAVRARSRKPYVLVGWLWYVGTLVPVIGLVQVGGQAMADRYTYVPLIGLFTIAAWGVPEVVDGWRGEGGKERSGSSRFVSGASWLGLPAAALIAAFMACTWLQVKHWRTSDALFQHALAVTKSNHLAHNTLGNSLYARGRVDEAIRHYMQALRIYPDYTKAHYNVANALVAKGRTSEAIEHFHQALRIEPGLAGAHSNLGSALASQGRVDEAINEYVEALRIDPEITGAHSNLGSALASQGRVDEAIKEYLEALRIDPELAEAHNNLANVLAGQGRLDEAIEHYRQALRVEPRFAEAHNNLANALARQSRFDEAIDHYSQALKIKPVYAAAHGNLAMALYHRGDYDRVWKEVQLARRLGYEPAPQFLELLAAQRPEPK